MRHEEPPGPPPLRRCRIRHAAGWLVLLAAPWAGSLRAEELQSELRTWTSKSGKSSTVARLWKVVDEGGQRRVHLMKDGGFGVSMSMPWTSLSPVDVAYVEQVTADRRAALAAARDDVDQLRQRAAQPRGPGSVADEATLEKVGFLAGELLLLEPTNATAVESAALVGELRRRAARPDHVITLCQDPIARDAPITKGEALPAELQGLWWPEVESGDGGATVTAVAENQRPAAALRLAGDSCQKATPAAGEAPRSFKAVGTLAAVDGLQTHVLIFNSGGVWVVHGPTTERLVLLRTCDAGLVETGRAVFQIRH